MIRFTENEIKSGVKNKAAFRDGIKQFITAEGKKPGEIAYVFCSDAYLASMNEKYLHHTTLTDIITFDYSEKNTISGDILISVERVKENAEKFKVPYEDEILRVMVHGVLHLLGYKDKSKEDKSRMRGKEDEVITLLKSFKNAEALDN